MSAADIDQEQRALDLTKQGLLEEAEAIYRQLIADKTESHVPYGNLAVICGMKGRWNEVIELVKIALILQPNYPEAQNNLGLALQNKGDNKAAIEAYNKALELQPNLPEAHYNLGNALQEHKELTAAISSYNRALEFQPKYPEAHYNLGIALQKVGRIKAAIDSYEKALELEPNRPETHYNLGIALQEQGDLAAAIASYIKALKLQPSNSEIHYNLGIALHKKGEITAAISSYKQALKLQHNYPDAHNNLGFALHEQGQLTEAIDSYKQALTLQPNHPETQGNLSMAELLIGDYKNGLKRYEYRFKSKQSKSILHAKPSIPQWDGTNINQTKKLLLVSEQGLGDTLQFMRYALALRAQGISVSLCAEAKLHDLIQASGIDASPLTPEQANNTSQGHWIPLLSVPKHLNVSPDQVVIAAPYIKTTNTLIAKWKDQLRNEQRPLIGINWQGNPLHEETNSRGRSLPLEAFSPIILQTTASIISLQKGFGSEQLKTCSFKESFVSCQDQINETWDFLETAAIIANCDLVISSDTSIAHLAGGMGQTTWLLLKKIPEWRWGLKGDKSFWYPSMQLFRQRTPGDWDEVIQRITATLEKAFPDAKKTLPAKANTQNWKTSFNTIQQRSIKLEEVNIFCISLKDATERRQSIETLREQHGFHVYFIDAIDGRNMSRDALQQKTKIPIHWNGLDGHRDEITLTTEAACCLSHIKAWKTIIHYDLEHAIIIEDDVELQRLSSINTPEIADFIYLSSRANFGSDRAAQGPLCGSEAYYLTSDCCKKLLRIYSTIRMPVDLQWLPQMQNLIKTNHHLSIFSRQDLPTLHAFVEPGLFSLNHHARSSQIRINADRKTKQVNQILAPVSLGELLDKITILEIKTQRLQGIALGNVAKELSALQTTFDSLNIQVDPFLIQQLSEVNAHLWQIEDDIRAKEDRKEFDNGFTSLARLVYQQNDRRAAIKRKINTIYNSALVEEKSYQKD